MTSSPLSVRRRCLPGRRPLTIWFTLVSLALLYILLLKRSERNSSPPTLIVYIYYNGRMTRADESIRRKGAGHKQIDANAKNPTQTENLKFFLRHGLQTNVDHLFVMNSPTPKDVVFPNAPNLFVWEKENTCYDLGSFRQGVEYMAQRHDRRYKRYMMINASVRGPFLPLYDRGCWIDHFFDRITDEVKMVGTTAFCQDALYLRHIQTMVLAFDQEGYEAGPALLPCARTIAEAIELGEVPLTRMLKDNGYRVDALMTAAAAEPEACGYADMNHPGKYFGMNFHPYELIFIKTNRGIDDNALAHYTRWHDNLLTTQDQHSCPHYLPGPSANSH